MTTKRRKSSGGKRRKSAGRRRKSAGKAKQRGHWVYVVTNAAAGIDSRHTKKSEALKRAKTRAKRERGQVGVWKAFLKPGNIVSYNVEGSGRVWTSDWHSV
jgi:hypothetical protein